MYEKYEKYDVISRNTLLSKMGNRQNNDAVERSFQHVIVLPYSRFISKLRLNSIFASILPLFYQSEGARALGLHKARVIFAYSAGKSTFQTLYKYNFAVGCGREGIFSGTGS